MVEQGLTCTTVRPSSSDNIARYLAEARYDLPCGIICFTPDGGFDPTCELPGSTPLSGKTQIRKDKTDLIFNTSLIIKL